MIPHGRPSFLLAASFRQPQTLETDITDRCKSQDKLAVPGLRSHSSPLFPGGTDHAPPSPQPSELPADPERPGTLLETDEDIRKALQTNQPAQPADKKIAPASTPHSQRDNADPYHPTQRPPMALLIVLDDGKSEGEVVRLRSDRFIIGRSEGDFIIPHDRQISARHIEITRQRVGEKYRWVVTDLQSSNGLFIRVSRTILSDRTELLVGRGRYRFEAAKSGLPETVDNLPPDVPEGTQPLGNEAASPFQPVLVELVGGKVTSRLPLAKLEYWIGSDPVCAICRADDPFIEPRHIRLYRDAADVWHAQNNKTANGLWLKVAQITVADSCSFQIGEQRFRLNAGG
jgi:pSer/pThr/pTyr-binding forkhead associated (FHA) protein